MNNNQYHVHGSGDGASSGNGYPSIIQAETGISFGSGTTYNPAVIAFGTIAGLMGNTGQGPYRQTCDNLTIDANGKAPIGLSMYSGQEGTGCDHISITNASATGLDWCGNYPQCGDGLVLDSFMVTHDSSSTGMSSCQTGAWNVNQWSCLTSGICTITLTAGTLALTPSYEAAITGVGTIGGVNYINGTWNVGAVSTANSSNPGDWTDARVANKTGLFSVFNQIAISIPNPPSSTVSCTTGCTGTVNFYTVDMRIDGNMGRDGIKNATIDSINCTNPTLAEQEISATNGRISGQHLEGNRSNPGYTTIGQLIGADNNVEGLEIDGVQCTTGIGTCVEILNNQWNVTGLSITNLLTAYDPSHQSNANMIVDMKNQNTLTVAKNNIVTNGQGVIGYYRIGPSGAVGDVETNANCVEMMNGWCITGGVKSFYAGGVLMFSVNTGGAGNVTETGGLTLSGTTNAATTISTSNTNQNLTLAPNGNGAVDVAGGLALTGTTTAATTISTSNTNQNLTLAPNGNGAVVVPAGLVATAGFQFSGMAANTGFFFPTAGPTWDSGGSNVVTFTPSGLVAGSGSVLAFAGSGGSTNTPDTGISRSAEDVLAVGNGSAGDASGTIRAAGFEPTANILISGTAPTISSGFCGSSAAIATQNGPASFTVNVGTCSTSGSGTIGLPTAAHGWNCFAFDESSPTTGGGFYVKQTAETTGPNTVTLTGYKNTGGAGTWSSGDILSVSCFAR